MDMDINKKHLLLRQFVEKVKTMSQDVHLEIYNILKKHNLKYSQNKNGFFFDIEKVDDILFDEIIHYMRCLKMKEKNENNNQGVTFEQFDKEKNVNINNHIKHKYDDCSTKKSILETLISDIDEECKKSNVVEKTTIENLINSMEKEKTKNQKKTSMNKFLTAKKKYSKQLVTNDLKITDDYLSLEE